MKNQKNFRKFFLTVGICLVLISAMLLAFWQWNIHTSVQDCQNYVTAITTSIPEIQGAIPQERRDNSMPVLAIEENDFVAILEMPSFDLLLPVGANWGESSKYPCYFDGSVYNSTMQIGATNQKGQYDFYRDISVGDKVFLTDMEGNRYSYKVTDLRYQKNADKKTLNSTNSSLTIFVKNIYSFEYLIIFCDTLS